MNEIVRDNYIKRLNSIKQRNAILLDKYKTLTDPIKKVELVKIINEEAKQFYSLREEYERLKNIKANPISNQSIEVSRDEKKSSVIPFVAICAALGITLGLGANYINNNYSTPSSPLVGVNQDIEEEKEEQYFPNEQIVNENAIYDKEFRSSNSKNINYDIYYPNIIGESSLIVYLHGAGGGYPDSTYSLPRMIKKNEVNCSSVVLVPKTDSGTDNNTFGGSANMRVALMELINQVVEEENINPNKIIIIGHSYGADAAIRLASEFPNTFSCVVPISAEAIKGYDLNSLSTTNMLLYCGSKEGRLTTSMSSLANKVNSNNGNAYFETCENKGHMDVCSYLFGKTDLLNKITEYSLDTVKL